ncbi:MAG: M42 family metallopeptidase [Halanaerobacter sp.]
MLLKKLTEAVGVSSRENEVREIIKEELEGTVELRTDALGNLIAFKPGDEDKTTLMLAAHMDEIGLMITDINKDGLLSFKPIGGLDKRVLVSKKVVVGDDKITGVIGAKAIHLQKPQERKKILDYKKLYIDIGAKSKKEAKKAVTIGDLASFNTDYEELGAKTAKAKAIDDRIGCAALIKILKNDYDFPLYGVFTVQEEVGARGAQAVSYDIDPDLALVLEGTTASDVPDSKEQSYSTTLGQGPALTMRDSAMIANKDLVQQIIKLAQREEIDYQFRKSTRAGNDGGAIHLTKEGIPTAAISVPCRYIHSPASLINLDDYQNTVKLVDQFCEELARGGFKDEKID